MQVLFLFLLRKTANPNRDTGNPKLSEIESWGWSLRLKLTSGRRKRHLRAGAGAAARRWGRLPAGSKSPVCSSHAVAASEHSSPPVTLLGLRCHTRPLLQRILIAHFLTIPYYSCFLPDAHQLHAHHERGTACSPSAQLSCGQAPALPIMGFILEFYSR